MLHYLSWNCYCKLKKRCLQCWQFFKVWILKSSNKERKPVKLWTTVNHFRIISYIPIQWNCHSVALNLHFLFFSFFVLFFLSLFYAFNILFQLSQNNLSIKFLPIKIFLCLLFKATALQRNHKQGLHCMCSLLLCLSFIQKSF